MTGDTSVVIGEVVRYLFSLYLGLCFLCSCSWFHVLNRIDNWNVIVDWALKNKQFSISSKRQMMKTARWTGSYTFVFLLSIAVSEILLPGERLRIPILINQAYHAEDIEYVCYYPFEPTAIILGIFYDCVQIFTSTPLIVPARPKSTSSRPSLMSFWMTFIRLLTPSPLMDSPTVSPAPPVRLLGRNGGGGNGSLG